MKKWYPVLGMSLILGLAGCTPLQIGLGVGKICTSLINRAVGYQQLKQARLERQLMERALHPNDFLNIGDPLAKAINHLGPPQAQKNEAGVSYYTFARQRIVSDSGQVVETDLRVAVDRQKKITEIVILVPSPPGTWEG